MILRTLVLENFRQVNGRAEVRFAPPGDKNVTVVLGQNGSGKTTLLNAFLWCLYGELEEMENRKEIVCHKAVQDAAIGGQVVGGVSLVVADGPRVYTVSRRVTYQKLDGGRLEEAAQQRPFWVDITDEKGVTTAAPDAIQFVQQMLPRGLSGFFFFRGEDMEDLALQEAQPRLKKGVTEFLNVTLLDQAISHLKTVGKDFGRELANIAVGGEKVFTDDIEAAEGDLEAAGTRLETAKQNDLALRGQREVIERHLAESEEPRRLIEARLRAEDRKASSEKQEEEARKALATAISRDGFLWRADEVFAQPLKLAEEAVKRGEIPTKIKPTFVEDLLDRGDCVCGRPLDDDARACLLKWRGAEGLAAMEENVNEFRNTARGFLSRRGRFVQDCDRLRTAWAESRVAVRQAEEQLSAIKSELAGRDFGIKELDALQKKLRVVNDDITKASIEVAEAGGVVAAIEGRLAKLRADLARLVKDNVKTGAIQRRYDSTEHVRAALVAMREGWLAIVQGYLNKQLQANWQKVAQLARQVEFTPEFQLSIKELGPDSQWTTSAPSSANLRVLALCFVSALIKLAKEIGVEAKQKADAGQRVPMFQGGDYPLVMDAPFATMDKHFKRAVPGGLRGVVPQVVLLSSYDQWSGEVEAALRTAVGAAYVLELHVPGKGDEGVSIPFAGQKFDYVIAEPDAMTDWTTIREVTL